VPISDIKKLTLFSVGMWRRRYNQPESKERMPQLTIEKFRVQPLGCRCDSSKLKLVLLTKG
jgi:hypothetical protein